MKNKIISTALAILIAVSCCAALRVSSDAAQTDAAVAAQSRYAQSSVRGAAILHCFNWSYNEIKNNLPDIAAAGYTAVQTSPVQKPKSYKSSYTSMSGQWWKLYQPLTMSVADGGTWLGTKAELKAMCKEADKYGIKVIADIVANHMANNTSGGGYSHLNSEVESDLKNSSYYHSETYGANDNSRYEMTHGHIGMPDLNTKNSHVQQRVLGLLKECVDCGVDGFRFDAAKHIELPTDDSSTKSDFWPTVINGIKSYKSGVFCYGEILNTAATSMSNYTTYIAVTDNKTGNSALSAAKSSNASGLAASNYQMGAGAANSVLWAESHDTYMHDETSGVSNSVIAKAWAITGARAKSTSLYFARPNSTMGKASSDGGWKSTVVSEVNKFKNYFMGQSEYLASSGKVAYIERGTSGVSIAKLDGEGSVTLDAHSMAAGTYKDQISGNTFTVSGGKIKGTVGSKGVAVVYNAPSEEPTQPSTAPTTAAPTTAEPTSAPTEPVTLPTVSVTVGDVSKDGKISILDVTTIQRYLAELEHPMYIETTGDTNSDGVVDISDATLLQMYLAEYEFESRIGQTVVIDAEQPTTAAPATEPTSVAPATEPTTEPQEYTVYFTNSRGWSGSIYCYYWSDENHHMLSWPGEKMTYDRTNSSNQKIYRFTVPAEIDYLMFNNNDKQTVKIPFDGTALRFYAKSSTDSSGKYEYGTW